MNEWQGQNNLREQLNSILCVVVADGAWCVCLDEHPVCPPVKMRLGTEPFFLFSH